jgi:hypothetical protein
VSGVYLDGLTTFFCDTHHLQLGGFDFAVERDLVANDEGKALEAFWPEISEELALLRLNDEAMQKHVGDRPRNCGAVMVRHRRVSLQLGREGQTTRCCGGAERLSNIGVVSSAHDIISSLS